MTRLSRESPRPKEPVCRPLPTTKWSPSIFYMSGIEELLGFNGEQDQLWPLPLELTVLRGDRKAVGICSWGGSECGPSLKNSEKEEGASCMPRNPGGGKELAYLKSEDRPVWLGWEAKGVQRKGGGYSAILGGCSALGLWNGQVLC